MAKHKNILREKFSHWLIMLTLVLALIFYLMPVYVMVMNGLKEAQGVSLTTMWNLPESLSGGGFVEAWQRLKANLYNSLMMVIPATIISFPVFPSPCSLKIVDPDDKSIQPATGVGDNIESTYILQRKRDLNIFRPHGFESSKQPPEIMIE